MIEPMTVRRIRERTRSVLRGVTTLERGNDQRLPRHGCMPMLRVTMDRLIQNTD